MQPHPHLQITVHVAPHLLLTTSVKSTAGFDCISVVAINASPDIMIQQLTSAQGSGHSSEFHEVLYISRVNRRLRTAPTQNLSNALLDAWAAVVEGC